MFDVLISFLNHFDLSINPIMTRKIQSDTYLLSPFTLPCVILLSETKTDNLSTTKRWHVHSQRVHLWRLKKFGWFCCPLSFDLTVWVVANLKSANQRLNFKVGDDERHCARPCCFLGSSCCVGKKWVDSSQGGGGAAEMELPANHNNSGRHSAPYPRFGTFASHRSLM